MIDEGSNGMSYDFGVAIAKGTVAGLAATVTGVVALTGTIVSLVSAADEMDKRMNSNRIAFGGYANTMKAVQFAQQKTMNGAGFALDDQLKGFRDLQRSGMDAVKSYDLVAAAAQGTGSSFSDMTAIIRGGDFGQLADMGIITDRMAMSMDNMGMSTRAASAQVVKLLKEAQTKGMFKDAIPTLESIMMRFKQFKAVFVQSIVGDPKDPEGLAFNVKKYMNQIADFIGKHINRIIYIGKIIGRTFRMFLDVIGVVIKSLFGYLGKMMHVQEKSKQSMQDSLLSFGLWAQFMTERIRGFFEKYGDYIWGILKILAIYKAFKFANSLWWGALKGAAKYFRVVKFGLLRQVVDFRKAASGSSDAIAAIQRSSGGLLGGIFNMFKNIKSYIPLLTGGISSMATGAWSFTAAMLANPIGLIVVAIAAIAATVYLLVKYWDDIWLATQGVSDGFIALISVFTPIVGIVMLMAKYWEEIKAIAKNLFLAALLWIDTFKMKVKLFIYNIKQFFNELWTGIVSSLKNAWAGITEFFSSIWASIAETFNTIFGPIMEFFGNLFQPLMDAAKTVYNYLDENLFSPIKDFFVSMGSWISENILNPIGKFFSKISTFFGDMFGKGVDKSQQAVTSAGNANLSTAKQLLDKGLITKDEYNKKVENVAKAKSASVSNSDVQQIKASKQKSMEETNSKKRHDKFNASVDKETGGLMSSSISAPVKEKLLNSDLSTEQLKKIVNTYNITVNSGSSDPKEIVALVMKELKQAELKNKLRKGE